MRSFLDLSVSKDKKVKNFKNIESLQPIVNVVNDSAEALNDPHRTICESAIPEVLGGVLGAGVGGAGSFMALYSLGVTGLSGAGIMSGLAAAGTGASAALGGVLSASAAGFLVLMAPVAILTAGGLGVAYTLKSNQLKQERERLYQEVLKKHAAIIQALKEEADASKERIEYLQSLNILLQRAIHDLQQDIEGNE